MSTRLHDDRREQRREDAEHQRDGEALDRAGAEREQHDAGDQRRDVRVGDRRERLVEAGVDRRLRRIAVAQLFADALVDQHVRVGRHADREHDARDARQRQRRLQQRHQRDQQHHVEQQDEVRDQPNAR